MTWWRRYRARWVAAALVLAALAGPLTVERAGDRLQIALPLSGFACSVVTGQAPGFAVRFFTGLGTVHAIKAGLGDVDLNARPNGGSNGFPSGHSFAAAFGASALVTDCLKNSIWVRAIAVVSAAYVGGSRVASGWHDILQVLVGFAFGIAADRAFRRVLTPPHSLRHHAATKE